MDPWEPSPWILQTVVVGVVLAAASEDAWARNQIQMDPQIAAAAAALTLLVVVVVAAAAAEETREDQMDSHPPQLEDPKHRDSIEYHLGPMPRPWIQPSS